jgi:hypothetical protein
MHCGLQNSVIRAKLLDNYRFEVSRRNEAEDQLFLAWSLVQGHRIAYFDDVHVLYFVHDSNSSASAKNQSVEKRARIFQELIAGFERVASTLTLTAAEKRAFRRRLAKEAFWHLGYTVYLENGHYSEAFRMFRKGLAYWPWSLDCWKVYFVAHCKYALNMVMTPLVRTK